MKHSPRYMLTGVFIIVAIVILIAILTMLGLQKEFQKKVYVETYFNESIQGLSVGSEVKYRGVQIGTVSQIGFTDDVYDKKEAHAAPEKYQYVYAVMAISLPKLTKVNHEQADKIIQRMVHKGLRVRIAMEGLTGGSYLEFNFFDPSTLSRLPIDWKPKYIYVPSRASTLTQLTQNLGDLFSTIKDMKLDVLSQNINEAVVGLNKIVAEMNYLFVSQQYNISQTLNNMNLLSANLNELVNSTSMYPSALIFSKPPKPINLGD